MQSTENHQSLEESIARVQDWADDTERDDYLDEDIRKLLAALAAERDRADRAEVELDAVTSLDVDHFMDIWDSLPRVSYTTRVAMAQAAVELIKQATA